MEDSEKKIRRGLSTEFVVALCAVAISLATLGVYIYQARIMQSQQHASVWPYLEWTLTFSTIDGIFLSVTNKGVGPAIVKDTRLTLDGEPVNSGRELMNKLTHGKADSIWSFTMAVNKRVIAPGEEIRLFHMKDSSLHTMDFGDIYQRLKYEINYSSIYGDCWVSEGLTVREADCKN